MFSYNIDSYPQKGKKINAIDRHSKYLVKVFATKDVCESFYHYSSDFYYAAHTITSYLLETENSSISQFDTYFFSLAFLYRHCIELKLKAIAFQSIKQKSEREKFVKETFHNLEEILDELKSLYPEDRLTDELEWLTMYFANIAKMDKESDSFRYPFHVVWEKDEWFESSGVFSIKKVFEKQTNIDLVKFANKFEAAYEILEKWYCASAEPSMEWNNLSPIFIEEGGYYYGQSVVGYAYCRDDFYPYTKAYLETANYLRYFMKQEYEVGNKGTSQRLFLPMCYLYRNCVEISLKSTWFEVMDENLQERCKQMLDKKHSIVGMWKLIKPFALRCGSGDKEKDNAYISLVENYCEQLQGFDSDSSKFRYPVQKNMTPYFRENKRFDFWETGIFLEALNNALDGINAELSIQNEYFAEMEAEYRSEMMVDMDCY